MNQQKTFLETSAGGIVFRNTSKGREWLMIQHSVAKHWGFPKGHIGDTVKDEKKEEAALREVQEEGGVKAKIISHESFVIQYYFKLHDILRKKTVYYYLMEYLSGNPEDHDFEVEEARFVPENEVVQALTFENDKEAFKEVLKRM